MKRRNLLKIFAAAPIVAAIPSIAVATIPVSAKETTNWDNVVEVSELMQKADIGNNFDADFTRKGNENKAFLNNKEIPLEDCLTSTGAIQVPVYFKEGDIFTIKTPYL